MKKNIVIRVFLTSFLHSAMIRGNTFFNNDAVLTNGGGVFNDSSPLTVSHNG